jgi:hypothetical protein
MGGAFVIHLILTAPFMLESAHHRSGDINIDTEDEAGIVEKEEYDEKVVAGQTESFESCEPSEAGREQMMSFLRTLLSYDGYHDSIPVWRTLAGPFGMLSSPIDWWASLMLMTMVWWVLIVAITLSQIFS